MLKRSLCKFKLFLHDSWTDARWLKATIFDILWWLGNHTHSWQQPDPSSLQRLLPLDACNRDKSGMVEKGKHKSWKIIIGPLNSPLCHSVNILFLWPTNNDCTSILKTQAARIFRGPLLIRPKLSAAGWALHWLSKEAWGGKWDDGLANGSLGMETGWLWNICEFFSNPWNIIYN